MAELLENFSPYAQYNPTITTLKNMSVGGTLAVTGASTLTGNTTVTGNLAVTGTSTFTGTASFLAANVSGHATSAAINSTAAATAAQVATGYITSTSAAPTTITLPTGTLLGAQLGATAGSIFRLYVDNTAGASTVTIAVAVNGIKSDAANTTAGSFGQLTVASGVTGLGEFTLMFSSATAYVFTRTA